MSDTCAPSSTTCGSRSGTFLGNPLRSLLTLLGIVIGVTTVVTMMGLIEGLRIKVNTDLTQLGANTFQVAKWPSGLQRPHQLAASSRKRPDLDAGGLARASLETCPSVAAAAATRMTRAARRSPPRTRGDAAHRERRRRGPPSTSETNGVTIATGRFFSGDGGRGRRATWR